jgi:hypothetical protein
MQTADVVEINRVLGTFPEGAAVNEDERRDAQRFAFSSQQTVAPYSGKDMPRAADFRRVPCHDISAGGMSFYWDRLLDFEYVVVALESSTASMRLIGRTTFCVPEGERRYRIGCQFVKRLK